MIALDKGQKPSQVGEKIELDSAGIATNKADVDAVRDAVAASRSNDIRSTVRDEVQVALGPHTSKSDQIKWMVNNATSAIYGGGSVNGVTTGLTGSANNSNPFGAISEAERFLNDTGIINMTRGDLNTAAAMFNQRVGGVHFPAAEVQAGFGNFVHFPGGYPHARVESNNQVNVYFTTGPNGSGSPVRSERF